MAEKTELLEEDEKVVEIELERLRGFENHPFKVRADSQMIKVYVNASSSKRVNLKGFMASRL